MKPCFVAVMVASWLRACFVPDSRIGFSHGEERRPTPSWGITPVPERLRVLSGFDSALLWGNLSVSLLVIVIGALLVPALSLRDALLAIVVGAIIGNVLLGLAALIGADARVPGMVVLRAPLGRKGSYAPTALNVAQNVGWSTFELIIIASAAAALSNHLFGWKATWLWTIVFGARQLGRSGCSGRSGSCAAICGSSRPGRCCSRWRT